MKQILDEFLLFYGFICFLRLFNL